jgi:hypothetical protein
MTSVAATPEPITKAAIDAIVELSLSDEAIDLLKSVRTGADVWERWAAKDCRHLETLGLVRIVKARSAPKDGAMRQPYFGCVATARGKAVLQRGLRYRRLRREKAFADASRGVAR